MSTLLKKSITNNGMIKMNKKVRKFRSKSGRVLLSVFCVIASVFFHVIASVFYGIAANSTVITEYPSLAQTQTAWYIPSFSFW